MIKTLFKTAIIFLFAGCNAGEKQPEGGYYAGDFHQHTTYSGGEYTIGHVMQADYKYGLDWWSNSDHGGVRELWGKASGLDYGSRVTWQSAGIKLMGDPAEKAGFMWRWQSLKYYNFEDILLWRNIYPDKLILQAFEWNVPGHEHANISIITNQFDAVNPNCDPVAQFEYMFDDDDLDTTGGKQFGWIKSRKAGKEKALEAAKWIQENHAGKAYVIESHPDKSGKYTIADFRNFNNAAPDVFFGFDGMPGHQKNVVRGGYDPDGETVGVTHYNGRQGATFGGAGIFMSKVGGLWDALLSEGRHWWVSASSDYHDDQDFYPGEYQKTYTFMKKRNDPQALIDALRSGNTFISTGELVTSVIFRVEDATMGETAQTSKEKVRIEIEILDPQTPNFNTYSDYTNPGVDHMDIIAGIVTGKISPESRDYGKDKVSTTRVIARFDGSGGVKDPAGIVSQKWTDTGDGWKKMTFEADFGGDMYFRLRATNHPLNTPEELDGSGNPLPDIAGENTPARAFADLWFYSNPIFVEKN